ncbi:antibiotic biosynthesis monooxygenase [Spongiactinospora gelatinilytica]|uniref:Antibiotic biosynthesis monooxygenase n=1 Tax=Spongiactinospora gelatinilytica TaxID=2666298 RepID=A0A2W2G531_9ACTN|nr:antibiotic biosynthesis monooxygenase family protein [Spongiactinospora gelatinilytica]PZG35445.1 antibiotic biosynthesis monooxygenase [Spongiactinospora gelatinilytica]
MSETTIRTDDQLATFINVIDVDPAKQEELIAVLNEGTEKVISQKPGFVSVNIIASKDGKRVINYAQWRSPADVQALLSDPEAQAFAKRVAELGTPGPGLYSVNAIHHA